MAICTHIWPAIDIYFHGFDGEIICIIAKIIVFIEAFPGATAHIRHCDCIILFHAHILKFKIGSKANLARKTFSRICGVRDCSYIIYFLVISCLRKAKHFYGAISFCGRTLYAIISETVCWFFLNFVTSSMEDKLHQFTYTWLEIIMGKHIVQFNISTGNEIMTFISRRTHTKNVLWVVIGCSLTNGKYDIYRQICNTSGTKSPNVSHLVLRLSLPNQLKPGVK